MGDEEGGEDGVEGEVDGEVGDGEAVVVGDGWVRGGEMVMWEWEEGMMGVG
ncbi:hypothetical protein [Kocuria rhizophila]|uniref:hypothetical protein n=1 Tax=Kocuria rhizophila TaxID=72000 RepID=UPI0016436663|nr:hypothetical protein [Kocuria rhizophila]